MKMDIITEILILTTTGRVLAKKRYKFDIKANLVDLFMSKLQDSDQLLPHFEVEGITFYQIRQRDIHFVAASVKKICPIYAIEILTRIYNLLKDFCGSVTEDSMDKNMILVYEVLDEMFDDGFLQLLSTEKVKSYILSEPVVVQNQENLISGLFGIEHRLAPCDASNRPVIRSKWDQEQRKNEIFLDVIERLNVLVAADGTLSRCDVQGQVKMKCFLMGAPEIKLGLNEDIIVGRDQKTGYGSTIHLDKLAFHPCVKSVSDDKVLSIQPPEGEFTLISYGIQGELPHGLPFRIYTYKEDRGSARDFDVGIKIRCEIPSHCQAVSVSVHLPVPKSTTSMSQRLSGTDQSASFTPTEKKIIWKIKKICGKNEVSAHFTLIGAKEHSHNPTDLGPVALTFEISGFVTSGLQMRFVRVFDREQSYVPTRWIRYISTADSYVCKV